MYNSLTKKSRLPSNLNDKKNEFLLPNMVIKLNAICVTYYFEDCYIAFIEGALMEGSLPEIS